MGVDAEYGRNGDELEIVPVPAFATIMCGWCTIPHRRDGGGRSRVAEPVLARPARGWRIGQSQHPLAPRPYRRQCGDQERRPARDHRPGRRGAHSRRSTPLAEGDRVRLGGTSARSGSTRPYRRPHRPDLPRRADRVRRRHHVRDGLRPAVRGHARADARQLQRLAALPRRHRVYCGHEYTLANARFAGMPSPEMRRSPSAWRRSKRSARRRARHGADDESAGTRDQPFMRAADCRVSRDYGPKKTVSVNAERALMR